MRQGTGKQAKIQIHTCLHSKESSVLKEGYSVLLRYRQLCGLASLFLARIGFLSCSSTARTQSISTGMGMPED